MHTHTHVTSQYINITAQYDSCNQASHTHLVTDHQHGKEDSIPIEWTIVMEIALLS